MSQPLYSAKITDFALRHFDKKFGGTKILSISPEEFQTIVDEIVYENLLELKTLEKESETKITAIEDSKLSKGTHKFFHYKFLPGYAPFCKLIVFENFTNAKTGTLPITLENYQYLRSGYSSRRDTELPVFSRWFELPIAPPVADYLVVVLYDKEQIDKEAMHEAACGRQTFSKFDGEWGIISIMAQQSNEEEPMKPETMMRNALGIEEGGSGFKLNREQYLKSVDFWSKYATVK